eukprot:CAMPEP_0171092872 /NCGR_PEP_ID=MMETSP0766_2-20121228/37821_1 /TAXON_ID=439317 /ORGANISM="Gambierdiscus australes, Strain CAWD 149" /LENGTH=69 /DNA_ID=CAMNT_0011551201 /DNA_START=287 /DNA_END=496 /DNA_ORIENTATION=-
MKGVPEVIGGYGPQQEPENAHTPRRVHDMECFEVLRVLGVQAVTELSQARHPHAVVTKLHPHNREGVVL